MAKVVVNYDTVTKQINVNMDGVDVPNVVSVSLSKKYSYTDDDGDSYNCCITTQEKVPDDKYEKYTQVLASKDDFLKKILNKKG